MTEKTNHQLRSATEVKRFLELNPQCWVNASCCDGLFVTMYIVLPAGDYLSATGWDEAANDATYSPVPMPDWCIGQTIATVSQNVSVNDLSAVGLVQDDRGWHCSQEAAAGIEEWFLNQLSEENRQREEMAA